jgi:membrane protease YdiL (CAAX protease family)
MQSQTPLLKLTIILTGSLLIAIVISPFVFLTVQYIPLLSQYPFYRVFNRVAEILIIAGLILGWKWINVKFQFGTLLRRDNAAKTTFIWFLIGSAGIILLMIAQTYVGLRIYRDRDFDYLLSRFGSALITAATVGFIEEIIFRGYILHTFSQSISRYKSILLTSLIFAFIHLFTLDYFIKPIKEVQLDGTDILAGWNHVCLFLKPLNDPLGILPGLIGLFLTGVLLAELTVKARTLWPAIGLHAGLVFSLQFIGKIFKYRPTLDAGPAWFYGEKFAPSGIIAWIILCSLILWIRMRKQSESGQSLRIEAQ